MLPRTATGLIAAGVVVGLILNYFMNWPSKAGRGGGHR